MRLKKCIKCGKLFSTVKEEKALCDDCIAAAKSTTIRPRTCRECGVTFDGGPRAWYCPNCRAIRQKEAAKRYRQNGPSRLLGSIDHCIVCGKEYVVNAGTQHYCPDCAEEAYRTLDREASKKWNAENKFYERRTPQQRRGQKVCVICGKPVPPGTPCITCSDECDKLRIKWHQDQAQIRQGTRKSPTTVNRLDNDFIPPRTELEAAEKEKIAEKRKAYHANYVSQNRKKIADYQAEYYAKNKERIKAQRKAKKERQP